MVSGGDRHPFRQVGDGGDMDFFARAGEACRLVEVAIVEISVPGNADQGSAHQAVDGAWIEACGKPVPILTEVAGRFQPAAETAEGHIGKGEEMGEMDIPSPCHIHSEPLFRLALRDRHEGPGRIGDQIQFERTAGQAVADGVEAFEHCNAVLPDPFAALGIGLTGIGGRERGGQPHLQLCTQLQKRGMARIEQENQIGAENESVRKWPQLPQQGINPRRQLRRAAGNVDCLEGESFGKKDDIGHRGPVHDLGASGTGLDMAVAAGKIAEPADIDLQRRGLPALQVQMVFGKRLGEVDFHGLFAVFGAGDPDRLPTERSCGCY